MIKSEVEVCAKIIRSAIVKEGSDGSTFLSFGIQLPLTGRDDSKKDLEMSVSISGDKSNKGIYTEGRKVRVLGILTVRKKDGNTYFNLRADGGAELCKTSEPDSITGTLEFLGKIGTKGVETHTDKKGNTFKSFSAFSSDKDGDNREFTWVRFLHFHPQEDEDFLTANAFVKVVGDLQLGVFRDAISIDCRVNEVTPWQINK